VISLQYGTNKGASQTGIVMGNTRHMWWAWDQSTFQFEEIRR
jgi:hypothetical protein